MNEFIKNGLGALYSDELEKWLTDRGFYAAPASTKYHGCYECGLERHSIRVAWHLCGLTDVNRLRWSRPESPFVVGYFHDLCKTDAYLKKPDGYVHNPDPLLKGHGEKSVMLLSTLMKLTEEEVACIRYHMGAFTDKEEWGDYTRAIRRFPNVLWTHHADMMATHIDQL